MIPEPEQKTIAKYIDVKSLCRTDSTMTGREEMKAWQIALKGLESVALNKWSHCNTANNKGKFKGLL